MVHRAAVSVVAVVAMRAIVGAQEPDLAELLARAAAYVAAYERELGSLVAEERYTQQLLPTIVGSGFLPTTRELLSEFLLVRLPGATPEWAGYRNVLRLNGHAVPQRDRQFDALAFKNSTDDAIALWQRLNEESARYNLGRITRTVNVPTLALIVLRADRQAQFTFRMTDARERVESVPAVRLAYDELAPPTLVADLNGQSVFVSGRVWLAENDGRVLRTEFVTRFRGVPPFAKITVEYGRDSRLNVWVPTRMEEHYSLERTQVRCVARYSNYRRFETGARIVPESPN
jgi:hypothetical protein